MKERWKPLMYGKIDLTDHLLVSNTGKIWSLKTHKLLKQWKDKKGYLMTSTSHEPRYKRINIRIHRAVAFMFVDGYEDGLSVNHIDCNKENCSCTNLEWCTNAENHQHAVEHGLIHCRPVICNETKERFQTMAKAANWCGVKKKSMMNYFRRSNV